MGELLLRVRIWWLTRGVARCPICRVLMAEDRDFCSDRCEETYADRMAW